MSYYAGIDLHSNNSYLAIIDEKGMLQFKQKCPNDLTTIESCLKSFKSDLHGVVVESTFNWYWLVDGLMDMNYKIHLANPCACEQYKGLKHSNDKTDAIWLAQMLRLGILPTGYIYPKQVRSTRDLLRKRALLMQHKTALLLSLKGFLHNWTGAQTSRSKIKHIHQIDIKNIFTDKHNMESAQCLLRTIDTMEHEIHQIEKSVHKHIAPKPDYKKLKTVWGIGDLLAKIIKLETGDISRFPDVGHYASYCRCVTSKRISNEKTKGFGNKRNGNKYLAWAYIEAAYFARRFYKTAQIWFDKKSATRGSIVATKALSHKLARACYFVMRDQVAFDPNKLFA